MDYLESLGLAVALGCDAFAVGLGVGCRFCAPRQIFRLSFHFGFFQFFMPVAGWLLGQGVADLVRWWGPWLACAVLTFLGLRMIRESLRPPQEDDPDACADPTRGVSLLVLSLATSIDALGVGFSLGLVGGSIWGAAIVIGLVAGGMTWAAMRLGRRLSVRFGHRMGLIGGLILILIGVKMVGQ
ncbi:MAG: manganese efflux pump MntP family protein [Thermodesulfobacteriota bacterium]